ncbi:MAG: UDP-N-acetyl-D-glucosamine dehydrogenase, partial [Candidatus Poribacteria bacterium]|nr:UDP-N-acetyl-D-glucosamine dehydrogenase [Candidatus Poribacteria bacterium]
AVVGLGYVGLPLALLVDRKGYEAIGIDINEDKVKMLNDRDFPFVAEKEVINHFKNGSLKATADFKNLIDASVIIICVPTPIHDNNMPNLEPLENACKMIAPNLRKGQLVILESTVNPGVSENIVLPILEKESGLKGGKDFYLSHCPERINPGDKKWTVENIPRVVGSLEKIGLRKTLNFYKSIISAEIKPMMSLKEAEAVKIVENTFRDINIAFVNELAMSFSHLGIDVVNVINGAATKPFAFMSHLPGCGVGGHCIPVDPYYLIEYAKNRGFNHDFLSLARRINEEMPEFTAKMVVRALNEKRLAVNGTRVAVLGLSYKPEIDDCRESPAFKIIEYLKEYGADVVTYDPFVPGSSSVDSLQEALKGSPAVVVVTAHNEFKKLTPQDFLRNGVSVIVDGRNCLIKEKFVKAGIVYKGIGR